MAKRRGRRDRQRRHRRRAAQYDEHGCRNVWVKSHARVVCKRGHHRPNRHIRFH